MKEVLIDSGFVSEAAVRAVEVDAADARNALRYFQGTGGVFAGTGATGLPMSAVQT